MPPSGGSSARPRRASRASGGRRRYSSSEEPDPEQGSGRGCLLTAAVGAAVLMLAAVLLVGYSLLFSGDSSPEPEPPPQGEPLAEHGDLPPCSAAEGPVLEALAPGGELRIDDTEQQEGWEVRDCQWSSASVGYGERAGFAAVLFIRNVDDVEAQLTGAEIAVEDLAADVEQYGGAPVEGLGDEAGSWYNPEDEVGCVGAVTANLYIVACHDAQDESGAWGGLGEEEAVSGAEKLADHVVPRIAVGEY